jgi:hypothetical protein
MNFEEANKRIEDLERSFKDKFRFAFVKPGERYSSVWSAWARPRKSDYYIGARGFLGNTKISLHGSRICRLALTEQHFATLVKQGLTQSEDRPFVKWKREPTPPVGAKLAVILIFPTNYMTLDAPVLPPRKVLLLNAAPPGRAMEVGFFYSREPVATLEPKFLETGTPVFWNHLDNGESVWIVMREAPFDPAVLPSTDQFNAAPGQLLDPDFPIGVEHKNLTAMLWSTPKSGEPLHGIEISGLSMTRHA